jgi:hypothetical protein
VTNRIGFSAGPSTTIAEREVRSAFSACVGLNFNARSNCCAVSLVPRGAGRLVTGGGDLVGERP